MQSGERVRELIDEYAARRRAGEALTLEQFAAEHPEAAEALRNHLGRTASARGARPPAAEPPVSGASGVLAGAELPTIAGYEVLEEIGRGGMGVVYRAMQVATGRVVALKVMLGAKFASPRARRRFEREVELAARLQHPGIVRVLESGDAAGQRYYVMDYVAGDRLDCHLAQSQADVPATLELFLRVCAAMEHAHASGVVHRDLKPGNILIDDRGNPHVLDFGLAKAADPGAVEDSVSASVSFPGQVLGTLSYVSPEQAAGFPETVDARADVYALGVMLFEALTGTLPFEPKGPSSEIVRRILEAAPTRPSSLSPRVDTVLETIILKALVKEKRRRYQSVRELADELRRYLAGKPILARRPSRFDALGRKLRKHRLWVATAAAAAVVALGVLLIEWRAARRELHEARLAALRLQAEVEGGQTGQWLASAKALFEQNRRVPEIRLVWAHAQFRNEDARDSALSFLERVLKREPSRWECRALLAEMYEATGAPEPAAVLRAAAARDDPDTPEAWYLRSFATLDLAYALRCADESARRGPTDPLAWNRLTRLCLANGDLLGALRGSDRLIELGADFDEWVVFKGQVLARSGRFREAIEQYSRAKKMPGAANLYRAHAYRRIKEYAKAVEDYTRLLERYSEGTADLWHFYQRATPLWILGRAEEALEDYRRVRVRLGRPFYSDARRHLILRELGRAEEAQQVLATALRETQDPWLRQVFLCLAGEIAPDALIAAAEDGTQDRSSQLCEAYYYAGEVHRLAGQRDAARACFERCVQTGIEFDPDILLAVPMNEFELAQWRLDQLAGGHPTSRPGTP